MSDVILRAAGARARTNVSNVFIDHYMKEANGEYVKVYLYLLRCLGDERMEFSVGGMADALDHTTRDIARALSYWEKKGLVRLEYDGEDGSLCGICLLEPAEPEKTKPKTKIKAWPGKKSAAKEKGRPSYSPDDIAILGQNEDVKEMLCVTERYLGRPLSSVESDTVLYWYEGMGLSVDLIVYLVEYCLERGHKSIHYMNRIAVGWAEKGISSVDEARASTDSYDSRISTAAVEFGITDRALVPAERSFLEKWKLEYGFSEDMIAEACKRTMLKAGKPSFPYADTILKSWRDAGAYSVEQVAKLDEEHRQASGNLKLKGKTGLTRRTDRLHNFSEHGYDYDAIEGLLIQQ